jgi:hypothetical protein
MENPMTRNGKILAGAAVILTLGSAAAIAHRHGGGHHKGHHGWGGPHGMMGLAGPLCRGNAAEKADLMMVRLQYKVNPTDAQKPAFEELKTAVKSAAEKVAAACPPKPEPAADGAKPERPAPKEITARLADTEAQLAAALEGVKIVRPAAEKLYATLDDAQKKAVSEIGMGKRGKWGKHHERWEKRGRDGGPDGERGGPGGGPAGDDGTPEREGDL